jgi:hypothetical protein
MRTPIIVGVTVALLGIAREGSAQSCVPRIDSPGPVFRSSQGHSEHESGSHRGGASFNPQCGYTNDCRVIAGVGVEKFAEDTGILSTWIYAHVTDSIKHDGSGTGGTWGSSEATGHVGYAARSCPFGYCDIALSFGNGFAVEVTTSGTIFQDGQNHTHTCSDSHEPAGGGGGPSDPPPNECYDECSDDWICDGETCNDEWVCDSYWDEYGWHEHCTLTSVCTPNCGWQQTCQQVCP